jgi:hypothetical protein
MGTFLGRGSRPVLRMIETVRESPTFPKLNPSSGTCGFGLRVDLGFRFKPSTVGLRLQGWTLPQLRVQAPAVQGAGFRMRGEIG